MITSIELQVISRITTSDDETEIDRLCEFDASYYSIFKDHIKFILEHRDKYGKVPDPFTLQSAFSDLTLVKVNEPIEYLVSEMHRNKKHIIMVDTFNTIKSLGVEDVEDAWTYIENQCEMVQALDCTAPMNIIKDADKRSQQVLEYSMQQRIPTGFPEIDANMYGGLSTVEELVVFVARTNTGKSWVATRMMETAQKNGFPVLYYSPEMQASFLSTRFDTWRGGFKNSQLFKGNYSEKYYEYIESLKQEETDAFILEDKDAPDGVVNISLLKRLIKKHKIKELIIDGLSYMEDENGKPSDSDHIKFKNLCTNLFKISKMFGCAIVIFMQANRETRENKDSKGEVFPNMYNIEGSDHPARIATQVFAMRQIFEKHILDIRMEKSRNAKNQKPEFSYSWDVDSGVATFIPSEDALVSGGSVTPVINPGLDISQSTSFIPDMTDDDEEVEF